jgi:hypothetical protein
VDRGVDRATPDWERDLNAFATAGHLCYLELDLAADARPMEAVRAYYLIPSADRLAAGASFGGGTECREEALRVRTAGRPTSIVVGGLMREPR